MDSRVDLDVVGLLENTDKSSRVLAGWDYLRHYEFLFADFRHAPIKFIEIGVAGGRSLRMWKWYFSRAQIIGVDIVPGCIGHAQDRVRIEIGSQDDTDLLDRICADGAPSIVIDDGSHTTPHRIATFEYLFARLAPGGWYVVEDFSVHVGSAAAAAAIAVRQDAPEYFLDIGRGCFANGAVKSLQKVPAEIVAQVDSAMYFANAVALRKKDPERDVTRARATADAYAAAHRVDGQAHENVAAYLLRHGAPPDLAEREVQKAIDAEGPSMSRLVLRAEILLAQKRGKAAKAAMTEAAAQPPGTPRVLLQLARLQEKVGDIAGAFASVELAVAQGGKAPAPRRYLKHLQERYRPG